MTCRHALDLIDAGPFADCPPAQLDAVRRHAAGCGTCGRALATSHAITKELRGLAQPAAPAHVKATVMARIAQVDVTAYEREAMDRAGTRTASRDWSGWAPLAGLVGGLAIVLPIYLAAGGGLRVWNTGGLATLSAALRATLSTVVMLCGFALFVAGLLVPLARRRR